VSRRRKWLVAGTVVLLLGLAYLLAGSGGSARGSALSEGPGGWLAARLYLEARGVEVALLDKPLDRFQGKGVLVVAFPWQLGMLIDGGEALRNHLRRGGDLVLAYSGEATHVSEVIALDTLAGEPQEVREPPVAPWAWRRFVQEEWELRPERDWGPAPPVRIWAPRALPEVPKDAEVLFRGPGGEPVVFAFRSLGGRVVVLPTDALANARLAGEGNAGLLETLAARLRGPWTFDEYHHGLVAADAVDGTVPQSVIDLLMVQLLLLYGFAAWAVARRFGPAWEEPPVITGSTAAFLRGLGALHHRLGHHRDAALLLLRRARELDRDLAVPDSMERRAMNADAGDFLALARSLARLRQGRTLNEDTETR
jgi:hypothetical protein